MKRLNVNLLSGLVLTIILLGVISAVTVYLNARTYRDLAFDFQRQYMTQLVAAESVEIIHEDADQARQLGLRIQSLPAFRAAFASGNEVDISAVLGEQYQQAPVTSNAVNLIGLYAFDIDFRLLGESSRRAADAGTLICPGLTSSARLRQGARRLKPLYELCLYKGEPYLAALAPVGGLSPSGYLQVVTSPISRLTKIGTRLKMPVRVSLPDESVLYVAPAWSEESERNDVKVDYVLPARDGQTALMISALRNADDLVKQIERTNNRLLLVVALIIIATVMLALLLVKYSVLKPLRELSYQLRYIWTGGKAESDTTMVTEKNVPVSFHELGELYETLHDLAIRDPLTGTYNRALLVDRLKQVLVEHRRTPGKAAILLIDMVRFKYVNDLLGHHTGDLLLKNVVERIAGELRESDTLARLGGDEFVVILPDTDETQSVQVAEKIIQSMYPDFEVYGHILTASVSIGIALMPEHGDDVDTLLHNADYAMYSAKDNKQGYAVFNPAITEEISHARMTLDGMLNADFKHHDLFLVYQPVIDFSNGEVSYVETLVRWRQSDGRILMPDSFIRVAEKSGLIKQLSEWVIHTACGELAEMRSAAPGLRAGINLSMHNLHDFNLMAKIQSSLDEYHLQPESLLLEITETGVMLDPNQVIETLDQLAGKGFRLSIDDFGTGHSSLVYLKRLPVHTLKVDKSFVIDMDTDEENASIIRATIDLAHSLGLTVTAEGVETAAVLDRLRSMGCDYYQGYLVSKPMSMSDMTVWLAERDGRTE